MDNHYPKRRKINDLKIDLWFGVNMFNYCKKDHTFSIFYNTKTIIAPYIPDHYILCYSTLNETPTFEYTYEQLAYVSEDLNHGALDENEHYFLLETKLFKGSLIKSLQDLLHNLKHILKYGEFYRYLTNDFHRFGKEKKKSIQTF